MLVSPRKRNTIQLYSKQQAHRKASLKHAFAFRPYIWERFCRFQIRRQTRSACSRRAFAEKNFYSSPNVWNRLVASFCSSSWEISVSYTHLQRRFDALFDLYKEWNAKINVISRKDIDNLYIHHVPVSYTHLDVYKRQVQSYFHDRDEAR